MPAKPRVRQWTLFKPFTDKSRQYSYIDCDINSFPSCNCNFCL